KDFGKAINVGSSVKINGETFEIIGILKKMGGPDDSSIIMTLDDLRQLSGEEKIVSMIFIKAKAGTNVTGVAERIEDKLKDYRNEKKSEEPKTFAVSTSEQILQAFSNVFGIVNAVLVGIAAISLLVGGVGIMNTMYTAVLERTREIGTLKAIGAKNSDVLLLFLFESGLLGLVGGAIGIALGFGIGKGAEYIAAAALGTGLLKASFSITLVAGALFFSFTIGALSGVMPAIQASRLKPVDALRWE
ncbi:FtsX-like permease family protein, partial [Candidatus Woesearchaeota archaeon]|nr:FtsX-like permease family protein [Candidatus Woesearchaeota archaeon]